MPDSMMPDSAPPVTEPDQVDHGDRQVTARWNLGAPDPMGWQRQTVLSVRHHKGFGYRATLSNADVRSTPGIRENKPDLCRSTVIHDHHTTARYSVARLRAAHTAALARCAAAPQPATRRSRPTSPNGATGTPRRR